MIAQHTWKSVLFVAVLVLAGLATNGRAQTQNWGLISPTGAVPAPRGGHGMVYDSTHGRMVMFGGASSSGTFGDVWEFDVATRLWTNVTPASGPTPGARYGHAMAYDPVRDKVVIHGGEYGPYQLPGDTWEWDTVNRSWTYKAAGMIGPGTGLHGAKMAFDPNRNQIILFGGRYYFNSGGSTTYAWNGTNWIDISPAISPSGRAFHMMATDTGRSKIVLFGGWQGGNLQDTWEWNGSTWTQIPTAVKPAERHLSGFSYDSERGVMVLFGGWNGYNPGYPWNDTWTYDGQNWTLQQPCDLPSQRNSVAMAYDPVRRRHVMFGGGHSASTNETWFYGTGLGSLPCGDADAPVTTADLTAPNAAGWNNSDVTVQLLAGDGEDGTGVNDITFGASGAHPIGQTTVAGAFANFVITAEGETVISYFATDDAGNVEATQTLTIRIDKTAPSLTCGPPDGAWHATDVNIPCTASDGVSGLANAADGSFSLSTSVPSNTETNIASTNSRSVCDRADKCATAGPVSGIKVDKKAPEISLTSPTTGSYLLNQAVTVSYSCSDGGSGVASCSGTTPNGGFLDTLSIGPNAFTVSSVDSVGNSAGPTTINYIVTFGIVALYDQNRAHKSGSTIPIKIRLVDADGANVSSASMLPHAISVMQTSSEASTEFGDAGNSNPDFNFRYDASLGGYIFNLQTTGMTTGTYLLNFTAGGSTIYSVGFQIRT